MNSFMRKVCITESQYERLFESITKDFGKDNTPGGFGSQVITSPIIHDNNGEREFSDPVDSDDIQGQLTPQQWGSKFGRHS